MSKVANLYYIKTNKETREDELKPLNIHIEDIICLYKDRNGTYIVNKLGFMYKTSYKIEELEFLVG